jgi:Uma2 family endonuclease
MLADTILSASELTELWRQCGQNDALPERYEMTEHGEVIMRPSPTNRHQRVCTAIAIQLQKQLGGEAVVEAAVLTRDAGVRIPDVVWMPAARWALLTPENDLLQAPELVVEVLSPDDRRTETPHKLRAYLASGTTEVLVVGLDGNLAFHRADGVHTHSSFGVTLALAPELFS